MICSFATYANLIIEGSVYPVHVCHGRTDGSAAAVGTPIPIVKVASASALRRARIPCDRGNRPTNYDVATGHMYDFECPCPACPQRRSPPALYRQGHSKSKSYVS